MSAGKKKIEDSPDSWDEEFETSSRILAQELGLEPTPRKRPNDSVWVLNRPDPETGLIMRRSKERKRKPPKKKGKMKPPTQKERAPNGHIFEDGPLNQVHVDEVPIDSTGQPDDVENLLRELQEMLGVDLNSEEKSTWSERLETLDESWKSARPELLHLMLEMEAMPEHSMCQVCLLLEATVRCLDCSHMLCVDCDSKEHKHHVLHVRQSWGDGYFVNAVINNALPVSHPAKCQNCGGDSCFTTKPTKSFYIAVTMKGRRHIPRSEVVCLSCNGTATEMELPSIIQYGFWPGSIDRISHIYSTDLLKWIDCFLKNMPGSSLSSIAKAIEDFDGTGKPINKSTLSRALTEYRYCQHALKDLQEMNPMSCPACSHGQHSSHVDGNHKVYRFSKVPRGSRKPYYEGLFIDSNDKVNQHLTVIYERDYASQGITQSRCGNTQWKAATASGRGRKKLDECGLEVAGCRHAVAQKGVNMFTGEMYGYPHYLHVYHLLPLGVQYIWQDVICRYWPWAIKQAPKDAKFQEAVSEMKPALSVMHAKAHQWSCQVLWGGRNQEGAGAGAGEDMEQFFSYLSRLGSTTKNMSCAAREDTITEHVLFWNTRKVRILAKQLCIRYKRNSVFMEAAEEELKSLLSSFGCEVNDDVLQTWNEEVKEHARGSKRAESDVSELERYFQLRTLELEASYIEQYVSSSSRDTSLLIDSSAFFNDATKRAETPRTQGSILQGLQENLCGLLQVGPEELLQMGKKAATERQVSLLQEEIELVSLAVKQRKVAVNTLADTSKQRTRLRRKNEQEKEKLQKLLDKVAVLSRGEQQLTVLDAVDGQFPWHSGASSSSQLPWDIKKKAVDVHVLVQRYREEKMLLRKEMKSMLLHFQRQLACLQEQKHMLRQALEFDTVNSDYANVERYVPSMATTKEIRGMVATKDKGIKRTSKLLSDAVMQFQRALSPDDQLQMWESSSDEDSEDSLDENSDI